MFLSLLGDYYRLIDIKSTKLKRCLEDGLIRDFTIEVHALKNTSRMIGALELSERFLRLENYGNANDIESIESEFEETYDLFRNYKKELKSFDKTDELSKREITSECVDEFGKHNKKKILVIDDSGAMLRNVKSWLENKYQVILANSGAMAIKYLA